MITKVPGRELHRNPARARRATAKGPVHLANRGRTTHVLISIEEYERLSAKKDSIRSHRGQTGTPRSTAD
jgi:prevent-host-death family protein